MRKVTRCRVCKSRELEDILDLGEMPLANAFLKEIVPEEKYPLRLLHCNDCTLVQLSHVVDPRTLFGGYHYLTSGSPVLVEHFQSLAKDTVKRFSLRKNDLVVEIGSNDGVLLETIKDKVTVLGVDPAETAAIEAAKRGVHTFVDFFGEEIAEFLAEVEGQAKVIFANNVMAHIDDLDDVMRGVDSLLEDDGVFIFEVHWVKNLLEESWDQVYHEHLSYFSLAAIMRLAMDFGFVVVDAEIVPIHGQSLRVYLQKSGTCSINVADILAQERYLDYGGFASKVFKMRQDLREVIGGLKGSIAGYGASAKGNTLLNYCQIDLDYIVDNLPQKQWTYTPGMHIPVVPPDWLFTNRPDYLLLLAWNYAPAILHKEKALREQGTKFIIPIGDVRVV